MSQQNHDAYVQLAAVDGVPPGETTGEVHQPEGGITSSFMSLEPGVAIWTVITFVLLVILLRKLAWTPILGSIETREKNIRDSLEKAKEAQNESRRIANEQNRILAEARTEATKIIQSAKSSAEEMKSKIEHTATDEKNRILESANREIEEAKLKALRELKKTSADLALEVAEKLIRESMDQAKHKELVDKLIGEIEGKG